MYIDSKQGSSESKTQLVALRTSSPEGNSLSALGPHFGPVVLMIMVLFCCACTTRAANGPYEEMERHVIPNVLAFLQAVECTPSAELGDSGALS